jgi:CHAD domain-containing protein
MELDYVKLKEIKPVLSGYIREAQLLLNASPVPDDNAVHDIRVLMKKSRAVMKLIASQVDEDIFSRNYGAFREVGCLMCSLRDTSVLRKTIKEIRKIHPGVFNLLKQNQKLEMMMKKPESENVVPADIKNDIEIINELLSKAGYRLRFQKMENLDPKMLINELNNSYCTVTDCYMKCRTTTKPANIHEFRKRSKDFLYQLYFFRPLNPEVIKSLEKRLDSMTQNLGKYNDLSQLVLKMDYKYKDPLNTPSLDELIVVIREEQDRYLSKVWPIAHKIFCPGQNLVNKLGFRILMI